jgi:4-amino-4-deoxy-L-arabinose transferase
MASFDGYQTITLITGLVFFLISLCFHIYEKGMLSLIFLLLSSLLIFCFAALLDPFLNIYDERFHALVAKNLVHHPLKPTLYDDPVVNMLYDHWDKSYIWLHKQPLFLWQMALSFKVFGISEFTLRLPSVIMGIVLVAIGYRSGKLLVNERTGYLTGILIMSSFYNFELIAGRTMVDHNDMAFLAYVSLSIWAFLEYFYAKKKGWIYLIGLFAGCAILCKWLAGMLIYLGWGIFKILEKKYSLRELSDIIKSLVTTLVIVLPWQVYTQVKFPVEASVEQDYNWQHLIRPIEGHRGSIWFHFENFNLLFGHLAAFLIVPGFIFLSRKMKDRALFMALLGMVCFTYLFFSLVQTKMPGFPLIVSLLIFIPIATLLDYLLGFEKITDQKVWLKKILVFTSILLIVVFQFDFKTMRERHFPDNNNNNSYSSMLSHNRDIFKSLELPANAVIFNVKGQHYIESMFYTGFPSYRFIPTSKQFQDLKKKGRIIAIFKPSLGNLPDYLKNDQSTIILDYQLQGYN